MVKVADMIEFNKENKEIVAMFGFNLKDEYEVASICDSGKSIQVINDEGNLMSFGIERFKL